MSSERSKNFVKDLYSLASNEETYSKIVEIASAAVNKQQMQDQHQEQIALQFEKFLPNDRAFSQPSFQLPSNNIFGQQSLGNGYPSIGPSIPGMLNQGVPGNLQFGMAPPAFMSSIPGQVSSTGSKEAKRFTQQDFMNMLSSGSKVCSAMMKSGAREGTICCAKITDKSYNSQLPADKQLCSSHGKKSSGGMGSSQVANMYANFSGSSMMGQPNGGQFAAFNLGQPPSFNGQSNGNQFQIPGIVQSNGNQPPSFNGNQFQIPGIGQSNGSQAPSFNGNQFQIPGIGQSNGNQVPSFNGNQFQIPGLVQSNGNQPPSFNGQSNGNQPPSLNQIPGLGQFNGNQPPSFNGQSNGNQPPSLNQIPGLGQFNGSQAPSFNGQSNGNQPPSFNGNQFQIPGLGQFNGSQAPSLNQIPGLGQFNGSQPPSFNGNQFQIPGLGQFNGSQAPSLNQIPGLGQFNGSQPPSLNQISNFDGQSNGNQFSNFDGNQISNFDGQSNGNQPPSLNQIPGLGKSDGSQISNLEQHNSLNPYIIPSSTTQTLSGPQKIELNNNSEFQFNSYPPQYSQGQNQVFPNNFLPQVNDLQKTESFVNQFSNMSINNTTEPQYFSRSLGSSQYYFTTDPNGSGLVFEDNAGVKTCIGFIRIGVNNSSDQLPDNFKSLLQVQLLPEHESWLNYNKISKKLIDIADTFNVQVDQNNSYIA